MTLLAVYKFDNRAAERGQEPWYFFYSIDPYAHTAPGGSGTWNLRHISFYAFDNGRHDGTVPVNLYHDPTNPLKFELAYHHPGNGWDLVKPALFYAYTTPADDRIPVLELIPIPEPGRPQEWRFQYVAKFGDNDWGNDDRGSSEWEVNATAFYVPTERPPYDRS
jgi:hypothetical protein